VRSFCALVNPLARGTLWAQTEAALVASGAALRCEVTRGPDDARERAEAAARQGEVVLAVGGDGLARDVAGGVSAAAGLMGIVPSGRGNDLATALGLPHDARALAELLLSGPERQLDVLVADGVVTPGNVFVGVDSVAALLANRLRWLPGALVYKLAGVLAVLRWQAPTFTITLDGQRLEARLHTVVVANSGWYGNGLHIVPSADATDGLLDVLSVDASLPRWKIGAVIGEARRGVHVDRAEVSVRRGRSVTLAADRPIALNADGDETGTLPVTVTVKPGALRVIG
jgi:diacylglycerol kinase family enzyme